MGKETEREKPPRVKDAIITEDSCLIIEFNHKLYPHTTKAIFTPGALLALAEEYGDIPPAGYNDYPGLPVITEEDIFEDESAAKPEDNHADNEEA